MAKRKRTDKGKRRRNKPAAALPDKPVGVPPRKARERAARSALNAGLPLPEDEGLAADHMRRAMHYELWLQTGGDIDAVTPQEFPSAYRLFFEQWPTEAFEFYRHRYFSYLSWILGTPPWMQIIHSILRRQGELDPVGLRGLRNELESAGDKLFRQTGNAQDLAFQVAEANAKDTRLTAALQSWAAHYETEIPLWVLGVLGKAIRTGKIDTHYGGGLQQMGTKGSLVNSIKPDLVDTPLEAPFALSYDPELRNTLSHNDWELEVNKGDFELVDHKTGRRWPEEECWQRFETTQLMLQAVLMAGQLLLNDTLDPPESFADVGVVSFTATFPAYGDELPTLVVLQLWCFHQLDPSGRWLDRATVSVTDGKWQNVLKLTDHAISCGPPHGKATQSEYANHDWLQVIRIPIAPPTGIGLPQITTEEGDTYDVIGVSDEHTLPLHYKVEE